MINNNAITLLKKGYFQAGETDWNDIAMRVANAISKAEDKENQEKYSEKFYNIISNLDFIPSTPCLVNAGTQSQQLSSCFILELKDNIESIYATKAEMAKIFQKNGGAGLNISVLRPMNTPVETSKGKSCGCLGFMEEFNLTADVVTRNNLRKGALKIDLSDFHPDIIEFIKCKDDTSKYTFMNISVALSDRFMNAIKNNEDWNLEFPTYSWNKETYNNEWNGDIEEWKSKGYPTTIYQTIKAKELYHMIMEHAWKTGEPGVSFLDNMNKNNPNPHLGKTNKSNPCAEFTSIPYNSCNLGSINLNNMVTQDLFTQEYEIDSNKLTKTIELAIRFLDNMITVNQLPIEKINKLTKSVRSIGLGTMGLADMLYKLNIRYGSNECYKFINDLYLLINTAALSASKNLAKERGCYDEWGKSEWKKNDIEIRNSNLLSIAPNGSISFIANTSGGLEPNFALTYTRRMNDGTLFYITNPIFEQALKDNNIYSEEILQKIIANKGSCQNINEIPKSIQDVFVIASDITPEEHMYVMTNIQKYVDLSCSKTINLPNHAKIEDIEDIYMKAWENNAKGITVYRDGCREYQVLTVGDNKKEDVKNSHTEINAFSLNRGDIIQVNDDVIGKKRKLMTGCGSLHCTAFFDTVTGQILETYLSKGSTGGCNNFMIGLSRLISLSARAGCDIYTIADQLNSCGACPSYAVRTATKKDTSRGSCCPIAIGNALIDMYEEFQTEINGDNEEINENKNINEFETCPECKEKSLIFESGCNTCKSCGYSKCV